MTEWIRGIAQDIGFAVIGFVLFGGWIVAGFKAADSGRNVLAWIIGLAPFAYFILALAGAFR